MMEGFSRPQRYERERVDVLAMIEDETRTDVTFPHTILALDTNFEMELIGYGITDEILAMEDQEERVQALVDIRNSMNRAGLRDVRKMLRASLSTFSRYIEKNQRQLIFVTARLAELRRIVRPRSMDPSRTTEDRDVIFDRIKALTYFKKLLMGNLVRLNDLRSDASSLLDFFSPRLPVSEQVSAENPPADQTLYW
jgi:hypothetical protein